MSKITNDGLGLATQCCSSLC